MNDTDAFLYRLEELARLEGVTVDDLLDRIERRAQLLETPLQPLDRLAYVEKLICAGEINPDFAKQIIQRNPILEQEIITLTDQSKVMLLERYGIQIPEYSLQFDSRFNPSKLDLGSAETDWVHRTITLPTEARIQIPLTIAHEQGHTYHMENSEIFQRLKAVYDPHDHEPYKSMREDALFIIEGWASFVSGLYARLLDEQLGVHVYQTYHQEMQSSLYLMDHITGRDRKRYYHGNDLFERIFQRQGLDAVLVAANTFVRDDELRRYSE